MELTNEAIQQLIKKTQVVGALATNIYLIMNPQLIPMTMCTTMGHSQSLSTNCPYLISTMPL
jgi:hypothetical protein